LSGELLGAWAEPAGVFVQRFSSDGDPLGPPQPVNSQPAGGYHQVVVTAGPHDEWVVAWQCYGCVGSEDDSDDSAKLGENILYLRWFDPAGRPSSDQVRVDTLAGVDFELHAVAVTSDGSFLVTWGSLFSAGSDQDETSVQARAYRTPILFTDGFESGDSSAWDQTVE
jgi:hypothetical protein